MSTFKLESIIVTREPYQLYKYMVKTLFETESFKIHFSLSLSQKDWECIRDSENISSLLSVGEKDKDRVKIVEDDVYIYFNEGVNRIQFKRESCYKNFVSFANGVLSQIENINTRHIV